MTATRRKPEPVRRDTTGWLTRDQASDLLGVSPVTIKNWERRGLLHSGRAWSTKSAREITVYDPDELARMPVRARLLHPAKPDRGELEAAVFGMLDAGRSIREIVIELRVAVADIEIMREMWLETGGVELAITNVNKAELERALGPFATVAELVAKVRERIAQAAAPANAEVTP